MKFVERGKERLSKRISAAVASDAPLRKLANDFSATARNALAEADTLIVERVEIRLKRLPKNLEGFRIVHLSDIHHSPFTSLEHISRAVEIANELKPDMFVLTGDFVSHEAEYSKPMAEVMGKLKSELGTFACLGNHDHRTDAALITDNLRAVNIRVLINEGFRFSARDASIWLCGVDDFSAGQPDLRAALRGSFPDEMKLLLAHNPKSLYGAARAKVDLMLSGHTHGGQIRLRVEEKKILPRRKSASGLYRRQETQMYITRGIGTVVLPVRLGCPPEISLLELHSNNPRS
jgi:predicted MPP superfamily phosphohydrolase